MTREECLKMADRCVNGERDEQYGSPENNFQLIANLWMNYIDAKGWTIEIASHDVACMLALLKIARIATGQPKEDNWIDLAGYAACGCEIQTL